MTNKEAMVNLSDEAFFDKVERMTTDELIKALRENLAWGEQGDLMLAAADRLEELEEQITTMAAD